MTVYKYMPLEYVNAFLNKGRVLFHPLSYFRDHEDAEIRGDKLEGKRRYAPDGGLLITNHTTGKRFVLDGSAFESSARADHIYVLCTSTILSDELATRFSSNACVAILDINRFVYLLRITLSRKRKRVIHGNVSYYDESTGPGATWKLPDQIVMCKPRNYDWQHEYRFAFGSKTAFGFGNTQQQLVIGKKDPPKSSHYPKRIVQIGSLHSICRLHTFGAVSSK